MLISFPYSLPPKSWHRQLLLMISCGLVLVFILNGKRVSGSLTTPLMVYPELTDQHEGEFSVLTYNIAGLPQLISSAKSPRAASIRTIGKRISDFDIVNVQEDFNYNEDLYAENTHPYRTISMGGVPFSDGLSTLSKYPIVASKRIPWTDCSGADCLTPKGFSYTRIQLAKQVYLDVYNVHATAQNNPTAVAMRNKNLAQFTAFLQTNSPCNALLIMGDFNANYAFAGDQIGDFMQQSSLFDSWVLLQNKGYLAALAENFQAPAALGITDAVESIDKIYFRNSDELILHPADYLVQKGLFVTESGIPLSDHCAISLRLKWKLVNP